MVLDRDEYIVWGVRWAVRSVPPGDARVDDCYGKVCWDAHEIYLAEGPWEEMVESLIHETSHILTRSLEKLDICQEDSRTWYSEALTDTLIRNQILYEP
jgi:hypothetical protein